MLGPRQRGAQVWAPQPLQGWEQRQQTEAKQPMQRPLVRKQPVQRPLARQMLPPTGQQASAAPAPGPGTAPEPVQARLSPGYTGGGVVRGRLIAHQEEYDGIVNTAHHRRAQTI